MATIKGKAKGRKNKASGTPAKEARKRIKRQIDRATDIPGFRSLLKEDKEALGKLEREFRSDTKKRVASATKRKKARAKKK